MNYYFITGTSKGIGKALAEVLLKEETNVVYGISRNVTLQHTRYFHQHLDLSDIIALRNNLYKIFITLKEPEKIILINNAGIVGNIGYIGSQETDNFEFVLNVNTIAPAILMNAFISAYQQSACPKIIVNISSGAAQRPIDGWAAYCASKAALDMLSLTCQKEQDILGTGVKVYAISPGVVDTDMQENIRSADNSQFSDLEKFKALKENAQLQTPEEIAGKIVKLVEQQAKMQSVIIRLSEI